MGNADIPLTLHVFDDGNKFTLLKTHLWHNFCAAAIMTSFEYGWQECEKLTDDEKTRSKKYWYSLLTTPKSYWLDRVERDDRPLFTVETEAQKQRVDEIATTLGGCGRDGIERLYSYVKFAMYWRQTRDFYQRINKILRHTHSGEFHGLSDSVGYTACCTPSATPKQFFKQICRYRAGTPWFTLASEAKDFESNDLVLDFFKYCEDKTGENVVFTDDFHNPNSAHEVQLATVRNPHYNGGCF